MDDKAQYQVVVNVEEQYSLWPLEREPPAGWRLAGFRGLHGECLAWIRMNWTDMRPLSVRQAVSAQKP